MFDPAKWLRRLRYVFSQRQVEADMAEELETHRQMARDRELQAGVAWPDACAASRRAMGNVTLAREDARAEWIAPWLESVWQDLRYGVRHLRAHPVFTITTGATLLLATVLNTSFFTLFNATVLRTWPVPDAGRVVIVQSRSAEPGGADGVLMSDFEFMRRQARSFAAVFAILGGGSRVATSSAAADEFIYVQSAYVSANFFEDLRIPMAIGRGFVPEEDLKERPASVGIIGAGLLCIIATIVTGLVPALRGTRDAADFGATSRGAFDTRRAVVRTVLLGAQVTLSATLLFGATLLTRGLIHAWNIDPGYSLHTVSVVRVTLPAQAYDATRASALRTQLRDAFAAAGLGPVGMADEAPLQPSALGTSVRRPQEAAADARRVHLRSYSSELFTLLKIPVVAGRLFDERQAGEVVINEAMARVLAGLARRGSTFDRGFADRGGGRRGARRPVDRSRRGGAGDVHAADDGHDGIAAIPDTKRRAA